MTRLSHSSFDDDPPRRELKEHVAMRVAIEARDTAAAVKLVGR